MEKSIRLNETEIKQNKSILRTTEQTLKNSKERKIVYLNRLGLEEEKLVEGLNKLVYSLPEQLEEVVAEMRKENILKKGIERFDSIRKYLQRDYLVINFLYRKMIIFAFCDFCLLEVMEFLVKIGLR